LAMLWAGVAGAELFVQRMSIVVMLASVAIYFWGFRLLPLLAVPLTLFILAIPIPQIVFNKLLSFADLRVALRSFGYATL